VEGRGLCDVLKMCHRRRHWYRHPVLKMRLKCRLMVSSSHNSSSSSKQMTRRGCYNRNLMIYKTNRKQVLCQTKKTFRGRKVSKFVELSTVCCGSTSTSLASPGLRFKRASAAEHPKYYPRCSLFHVNRL
jgi:hypothetical protein